MNGLISNTIEITKREEGEIGSSNAGWTDRFICGGDYHVLFDVDSIDKPPGPMKWSVDFVHVKNVPPFPGIRLRRWHRERKSIIVSAPGLRVLYHHTAYLDGIIPFRFVTASTKLNSSTSGERTRRYNMAKYKSHINLNSAASMTGQKLVHLRKQNTD